MTAVKELDQEFPAEGPSLPEMSLGRGGLLML